MLQNRPKCIIWERSGVIWGRFGVMRGSSVGRKGIEEETWHRRTDEQAGPLIVVQEVLVDLKITWEERPSHT